MEYQMRSGATTIPFSSSGSVNTSPNYVPNVGARGDETIQDLPIIVVEGTRAAKSTFKDSIGALLNQAAVYAERKVGDRVYIEGRLDSSDSWWSSEIKSGELRWLNPNRVSDGAAELGIAINRANFWKGSETQAPLTNGNGTNVLTTLQVYNHNDSGTGHNNYVQISGADIVGDLPAQTRIEMTNTTDNTARMYRVWLAHNVHSNPASFQHVIEAESASYALGGSVINNSGYSGGATRSFVWTGDAQTLIARWALSTTFLNNARGNWFKLLGRFGSAPPAGLRLQFKTSFPSGTTLSIVSTSQEVAPTTSTMQDLATLQLPPWLIGETGFAPIDLCLYARLAGGGTFALDDLILMPLDGYRILVPRGYGAGYGVRLVDDGITETIWSDGFTPAGKTGHYTGQFDRIMLQPGKTQRIYFLQSTDLGGVSIDRTMGIRVYYCPRRLAL